MNEKGIKAIALVKKGVSAESAARATGVNAYWIRLKMGGA